MKTAKELAQRLMFDQQSLAPSPVSFAPTKAPFSQPHFVPDQPMASQSVPLPQPNPLRPQAAYGQPLAPPMFYPAGGDALPNTRVADAFSGMPSAGYQPQPQAVPLPQANPLRMAAAGPASQPVPLPQPNPMAAMQPAPMSPASPPNNFSGANGPQWNDQQWQNYWDRSQGQA